MRRWIKEYYSLKLFFFTKYHFSLFFAGIEITPQKDNGLVFYFGPMSYSPLLKVQDFMSLELQNGYAVLFIDYGTGTVKLDQKKIKLNDGKSHRIDVFWTKNVSFKQVLVFMQSTFSLDELKMLNNFHCLLTVY